MDRDFDEWLMKVALIKGLQPYDVRPKYWRRYYDEGYSPREAVEDDNWGDSDDF